MEANSRREQVLQTIKQSKAPISASLLAKTLNVSRQVIVGDVALLRAQGNEIIATARGYILPEIRMNNLYLGKIACRHNPESTQLELYTMVDLDAIVINVIVEHELYGEITGQLNFNCREDVDAFINQVISSESKLLSELSMGVHLHTIGCRDKTHFEQICHELGKAGFLFEGSN